ncbi:MAG: helix-turn-helix domain-containing protein, partial [Clostridia bacterium]
IVDKKEFFKELRLVVYVFAATIAVCLVLGICFAYYMTIKNHRPILRLMAQLDKTNTTDSRPHENELQYIDKRMTQLLEDSEEQNRKLVIHNLVLRDAVFSRFLQNEPLSDISMEELLESIGISFTEPYFAVVMFYIDDVKDLFFEEATEEMLADNYQLARLIISNILSDVLPSELHCAFCNLNGMFCCIINTAQKENGGDKIKQSLLQTQDFTRDNFGLSFMAGVSRFYEGYEGLSGCYKEALECMEYKLLVDNGVVEYSNISESQTNLYYFPIEKEIQLINTLKAGDYEKSQQLLQHIFEVNLHQARPQIQTAKCLVYDVMGCVMKVLNDLGDLDGNNVFEQFKVFERIDRCKTVLSIQEELTDIFKQICESSMNESVEKTHRLIEGIKTFVGSYYDDPNLSCEVISDHFKINQSYLSTMFRKYTNQGLLEYIVKMRVEKAKQLLEEQEMTVDQAAKRVGYINTRTFTRAFKKYMGTTPGKYHEMALHQSQQKA